MKSWETKLGDFWLSILLGTNLFPKSEKKTVLTIGNFDGVHLGHQKLLKTTRALASKENQLAAVLTFHPHPLYFFGVEPKPNLLMTSHRKAETLKSFSMDYVIEQPFDAAFAGLSKDEFVKTILVEWLQVKTLVLGSNFRFGKGGSGNIDYLQEVGTSLDINTIVVDFEKYEDEIISSSRIRTCVESGRLSEANHMLGRTHSIQSQVIQGEQRGRQLGFPTANLRVDNHCVPSSGVFAGKTLVGGQWYKAVTNIGTRPTFEGQSKSVEVHILDFSGIIYGQEIEFFFSKQIRGEQKFASIQELKEQIQKDICFTREFVE